MISIKNFFQNRNKKHEDWSSRSSFATISSIDYSVIAVILALLILGLIMVYSASISLGDSPKYQTSEGYFAVRHAIYIAIGLIAAFFVFKVSLSRWYLLSYPLGLFGILLLISVFVPGLGHEVNGSTRWIGFGPINLQVSEVVKFVSVLVISHFVVTRQAYMHSYTRGLIPVMLYIGAVAMLLSLQPDLGATVVISAIVLGVVFLGGLSWSIIIPFGIVIFAVIVFSIALSPWRTARVFAYLNPWDIENQLGKAYQLTHSLIAFGRGELFGVGLGASVEKMHYLPEAHTDFILAVIGEELGLVGFTFVLLLFYWLVRRAFEIGRQAVRLESVYSGLVAQGVGLWIGVQALINIGVAIGVFPTKGLTLPLVSYGGSSIVVTLCALALLLRVDYENRLLMRGKRRR
ncbi:putative lipid II flippase FtsW [Parasutterella secunda]|uniref:putative lipid II flippase FtsW n=1 Tax=Parasutterella secunda TaxID=626947 RepID=UPI0025A32A31|nr:putative lipid II flippase FtsW [Parasutterella secunda]MDM8218106.1 putative lipid II flippase FtsW [Parasutterella secunda]MDM8225068.1 putative lipid II flippase FtsW [Parasutterella secunda]